MKRNRMIPLLAAALAAALVGCGMLSGCTQRQGAQTAAGDAAEPYITFTDDAGREISLAQVPRCTAVLFSSYAEIWTLAGGDVAVTVGETAERGIVSADTPLVDGGAGKTINTELLLSLEPDFVICSQDIAAQAECASLLYDAGIAAAAFSVESFDEYLSLLELFCTITGNGDAYDAWGTAQKAQIDALLSCAEVQTVTPRILFIRASTGAKSTKAKRADDHFAAAMLEELGCENIADAAPMLIDGLSIETILTENPDAIFISAMGAEDAVRAYMDGVLAEEAWQTLDAVRDGRVYYLDKSLFQYKPNARWYEAYLTLYRLVYGNEP